MSGNSDEQAPGEPRLDTTGEFFSVGTPLHAVRAGYVRRRADELLYEAVVAGRYAHVIAPDRSGKSSLVAATAARLEAKGFNVAILDLEQIGVRDAGSDAGRWYYSVAYRLLRQLRIRYDLQSWWQDKSVLGNRQRLLEFYNEIVLQFVQERIAIFVDEIQCIASLPFGDQLLASIRSAHNARATDPEFTRLTFVLLGECDPLSLIDEPELSPFNVTQPIPLDDFSRRDLELFATELNLSREDADAALDRIYYWTGGQPYLTQKLARATAREQLKGDIEESIDRIVAQQLAGRAALHNEPHLSHIHREIVGDARHSEALLNLYGKLRKGVSVTTDWGSPLQRRLMAVGLIKADEHGDLCLRNRVYAAVFTARWANENLPTRWRIPAAAVAALLLIVSIPFWYTQWLPRSYVDVLTSPTVDLATAESAWRNLRSFPGHAASADNLLRNFLRSRSTAAADAAAIAAVATLAEELPDAGRLPDELRASFWDRRVRDATRLEQRDAALIAALESLLLSTPQRRHRAAMLVGDDYPLLLASFPSAALPHLAFDPANLLLTALRGARVSQWSLTPQGLQRSADWTITALEVSPLVRRVIIDREGTAARIGLTVNVSHPRLADLRMKLIAPSGRAVELQLDRERASSNEDLRVPAAQLQDLVGEQLGGTWSLSIRDEALGVAGHLVGWNLTLNSQAAIEDFQRGLQIPDPVERETDNVWISADGRYAVARAIQSDSVRIWDLAFAKPVRAVAVSQNETLIGLDAGARHLVTATVETINLWETAGGNRIATLQIGGSTESARLTADGMHLFVQERTDVETRLELWSLEQAAIRSEIDVAGAPALVALDGSGTRVAVADFDRAVRVWDFASGNLVAQIDLPYQPSAIRLSSGGDALGAVYGDSGMSLWRVDQPQSPVLEEFGQGRWQLAFSPSGSLVVAGRPRSGYQVYRSSDGYQTGATTGVGVGSDSDSLLAFSDDERVVVTGGRGGMTRFWRVAQDVLPVTRADGGDSNATWMPSGDAVVAATPDASKIVIGHRGGHVHALPADITREELASAIGEVSFLGHNAPVRQLAVSRDSRSVASAAADGTVRLWSLEDGQPLPFMIDVAGGPVTGLEISPRGTLVAILAAGRAVLHDATNGELVAEFPVAEPHSGIAFSDDERVYIGSDSGALSVIARDTTGSWSLRQLWQGPAAIRFLRASPQGHFLVIVDDDNVARQIELAGGSVTPETVALPADVEDVAYSPSGSRVFFRTARWVHRASSSRTGLIWLDAIFSPRVVDRAGIVFGDDAPHGNELYVPVARAGMLGLAELSYQAGDGAGLFGDKDELLAEWRTRLGLDFEQAPADTAPPAAP